VKKNTALYLILLYMIWGFNWVVMTTANRYFPPILFVALRFTFGAICLLIFCRIRKIPFPETRYLPWIALSGLLLMAVGNILVQISTQYLGAGMVAVLDYTMAVWMTILAVIFLREKITLRKAAGIALSVAGLFILMQVDIHGKLWAIGLTILAAVTWAIANLIVKTKLSDCAMIPVTAWQMTFAAAVLDIYVGIFPQGTVNWCLPAVNALLYNGIFASALAFVLWSIILDRMEAGKASVAVMAVPAIGVLSGVIFLHEPMTPGIAIGMAILFAGILTVLSIKTAAE